MMLLLVLGLAVCPVSAAATQATYLLQQLAAERLVADGSYPRPRCLHQRTEQIRGERDAPGRHQREGIHTSLFLIIYI